MDYFSGIAVLLWCSGFLFSLSSGQNVAEESPIQVQNNGNYRYSPRYDFVDERYKENIPHSKSFHDIFAVKSFNGETERVHFAVDDHGIRTNIHSDAVNFGPKFDPRAINFGSRFTEWPIDNFDSMFLNVPEMKAQSTQFQSNHELIAPVPSLELPPAFVPLRHSQPPTPPQKPNLNSDIEEFNPKNESPNDQVPSSVLSEPLQPVYRPELRYEPQRIPRPFPLNPIYTRDNLPSTDRTIVEKDQMPRYIPQKSESIQIESRPISEKPKSLLPDISPQLSKLNFIRNQYPNNQNLKWYQSLPQVPPAGNSLYSAPFFNVDEAFESQKKFKSVPVQFVSQKGTLQKFLNRTNIQTAESPNFEKSSTVRDAESPKSFANINLYDGSQKASSQLEQFPGSINPETQKDVSVSNAGKYIGYKKVSDIPLRNQDSVAIFESQKQGKVSNFKLTESQKLSNQPEKLSSSIIATPQKQLISANQYVKSDTIFNLPALFRDAKIDSQQKSLVTLTNADQYMESQNPSYQQNTYAEKIIPNQPIVIKGIGSLYPKNMLPSTYPAKQNKLQTSINSKLAPLISANVPFTRSKSIVSSPMSTIFDTSNENGQYYHYVMNVGKNSANVSPTRMKLSTVNLFKLLNDSNVPKLIDNKKLTGKFIVQNDNKIIKERENSSVMVEKLVENTNRNSDSLLMSDLDVSGDVIDATEISQDLPETTISNTPLEEIGKDEAMDKVIDEITKVINTEEPRPSTQTTNDDLHEIFTTQPGTDQTTSSFLADLFEISSTSTEEPGENTSEVSTKSASDRENAEDKDLTSLFITVPEGSLKSQFYENFIEGNKVENLEDNPSAESFPVDMGTTSSELDNELKSTTEVRDIKGTTTNTAFSYETSTETKDEKTATEASTSSSSSSEVSSTESSSSEISWDSENLISTVSDSTTSKLIPYKLPSTVSPTLSAVKTDNLDIISESSTEESATTAPTSSVIVDVVDSSAKTVNQEIADLTDVPTSSSEQQKPMLELVIQNTEMNDFMSRINNMPIMIRVLNPVTTTTEIPDAGRETLNTEENLNLSISQTNSLNEIPEITSTEATALTSSSVGVKNINDLGTQKSLSLIEENPIQPVTNKDVADTLISEPNFEDEIVLTPSKRQNTGSILLDIKDKQTKIDSKRVSDLTTPIPKSLESSNAVLLDSQSPETLQFTLIRPENTEILDSSVLDTTDYEKLSNYANKLASAAHNYNIDGPFEVSEDQSSTQIPIGNIDESFIPMFVDSDQVHASEESQKITNFKSINKKQHTKSSSLGQANFHLPSQPIIIKNSTVIQYQDISNYKGYDKHSPVQYFDLVPIRDIDYDSHVPLGNDDKIPSDAMFVYDDYDVLPPNPDGTNNEYVFIGNTGNFDHNILPTSGLSSPINFDAEPLYVIDSDTAKFGTRFKQETAESESNQETVLDSQQPVQLNFENFRPQRNFESNPRFTKEQWLPSRK